MGETGRKCRMLNVEEVSKPAVNHNDAQSITKYGFLVRLDAQIVHCARTLHLSAPPLVGPKPHLPTQTPSESRFFEFLTLQIGGAPLAFPSTPTR